MRKKTLSMMVSLLAITCTTLFSVTGCGSTRSDNSSSATGQGGAGQNETLNVYAAASLTSVFQTLGKRFEETHPGVVVRYNFAGSQTLVSQISEGAPADVFASADTSNMEKAKAKGLVNSDRIFAKNALVLIVPKSNPAGLHQFQDLTHAHRVIMGVQDVPIGEYARQSLQQADRVFGAGFSTSVLSHVVSQETDVKQIVNKIVLGEGDAAIVYRTDAQGKTAEKVLVIPVPNSVNLTATYPIAVVKHSAHQKLAEDFIQFILSKEAQNTLHSNGFIPVS